MIANPTPVTAATFDGMWITSLNIVFPNANRPNGSLQGRLLPFDGQHLLATGGRNVRQALPADALTATLDTLKAECKRQASKTADPLFVTVMASDPANPVVANIVFDDRSSHVIRDCFALAATDAVFGGVLQAVMAKVADLAGLTIT